MKTKRLEIWCASLWFLLTMSLVQPAAAQRIVAADPDGLRLSMRQHRATCMFFFIEDCPVSMRDFAVLKSLRDHYPDSMVAFVAVYVGDQPARLQHIADSLAINIDFAADSLHQLVAVAGARVTPEYFLFDREGSLRYRGAIDNYSLGYAKHRKRVTEPYLSQAIEAVLVGLKVAVSSTQPTGCVIEQIR